MKFRLVIVFAVVLLTLAAQSCNRHPICAVYATADDTEQLKETG